MQIGDAFMFHDARGVRGPYYIVNVTAAEYGVARGTIANIVIGRTYASAT